MNAGRFTHWREAAPSIVAESLEVTTELPLPAQSLVCAAPRSVAAALARLACPALAGDTPPAWLRPAQVMPWRQLVGAVREFRGGLLAEPPGTGKTWMALAAASVLTRRPVTCLVPAVVAAQWRAVASRAGIAITLGTHEQASRGRLPMLHELVIVDESHNYRNAGIRRYAHVARWIAGRNAILLTGTPVINRLDDLLNQLALIVRDDALSLHGIPSLRELAQAQALPEAIARVVIRSPDGEGLPGHDAASLRFRLAAELGRALRELASLEISSDRGVRTLVRSVLLRAAASSPLALAAALRRYGFLLANHADAAAAGCTVSRDALRRWAGASGEQTVLWAVLDNAGGETLLCQADREPVRRLLQSLSEITPAEDPKACALNRLLGDGRRTLVFVTARETVAWLRRAIGYHRTAWCTGEGAGIGSARWPREDVLRLFGPAGANAPAPAILISTDVAAEGLDLQRAERVVHYDLPWTPARMAQRVGRAARIGSTVSSVQVVRFDPPTAIERQLHARRVLRRKVVLPERAQLANAALAGWPGQLAHAAQEQGPVEPAVAWVPASTLRGVLAGLEITGLDDQGRVIRGGRLLWLSGAGVSDTVAALRAPLLEALTAPGCDLINRPLLRDATERLDAAVERMLAIFNGSVWDTARRSEHAALVERLRHVRHRAVENRDATTAGLVSNVLRLTSAGRTAGENLLLKELAHTSGRAALRAMAMLPRARPVLRFEVRVGGMVVFGKDDTAGRPAV